MIYPPPTHGNLPQATLGLQRPRGPQPQRATVTPTRTRGTPLSLLSTLGARLLSITRSHKLNKPELTPITSTTHHTLPHPPQTAQAHSSTTMMIFSFLIASVGAGPTSTTGIGQSPSPRPTSSPIINRCGVDGVVPHSYMVTLSSSLSSDRRLAPTSIASFGTNQDKLSVIKGWVQQYINPEDTSNGTTRRKLEANSKSTHAMHYFTQTRLAVAIEADKKVRHAPSTRPHVEHPALRVATMLTNPHTNAPGRHAHGQRPGRLLG